MIRRLGYAQGGITQLCGKMTPHTGRFAGGFGKAEHKNREEPWQLIDESFQQD